MASGYALPTARAGGSQHGHSHSFSGLPLTPERRGTSHLLPISNSNGHAVKKANSNAGLYTHAEASRETSPSPTPSPYAEQFPMVEQNRRAAEHNHHIHAHAQKHAHTRSWSPMKSRPRGDSDLGDADYKTHTATRARLPTPQASWLSLPEALTALLIPIPYILASATFSSLSGASALDFPPLAAYEPKRVALDTDILSPARSSGIFESCAITCCVLLAVGIAAKIQAGERLLDRRKHELQSQPSGALEGMLTRSAIQATVMSLLGIALPMFAAMQLGGARVGLIQLISFATGVSNFTGPTTSLERLWKMWSSQVATTAVLVLAFICDEVGLTIYNSLSSVLLGYLALILSITVLPPPLPIAALHQSLGSDSTSHYRSNSGVSTASSSLTRSLAEVHATIAAGILLTALTGLGLILTQGFAVPTTSSILLGASSVVAMAGAVTFTTPRSLCSKSKAGLALGCLATASCSFLFSPSLWPGTICNGGLSALAFLGVLYDTSRSNDTHIHHDHDHEHSHSHPVHTIPTKRKEVGHSTHTKYILTYCEPGSLVHTIVSERDSRRIAYFTALNFGFMIVQGVYGYLSGSLGLLSDTVHMFFDCLGLIVGLGAAIASKWPNSPERPHGWGKLNTLAGFGNGVFLMLVSVEFVGEAIEGMLEKRELRHVQELLVVSTLGLLVNMVGLFAFGHAHAGHDHGHSHSHAKAPSHDLSHPHTHEHEHAHHDHDHSHANGHAHSHECEHEHEAHSDHHGHHNDNMHGIFLHVAADAGGSLAVIISTALTLWKPWYLWDPLATIIIAILIFAAAVPLVVSSGQKLLLVIPDDLEYSIKTTLQGLGELKGVVGYAQPRFWLDNKEDAGDAHGHHHGHDHGSHAGIQKVQGVIHVIVAPSADMEDVLARVEEYTMARNMDLVIHVEREAEGCWCSSTSPTG